MMSEDVSPSTDSGDGYYYQEPGDHSSQQNLQSAQPMQGRVSRQRPQERDIAGEEKNVLPTTSRQAQADSDSDSDSEYLQTSIKSSLRPGKHRKKRKKPSESSPQEEEEESAVKAHPSAYRHERPNLFYGAPSTWLSWTRSERETVKALEQERAANLAAHLFVAHRIKKHAWSSTVATSQQQQQQLSTRGRKGASGSAGGGGGGGGGGGSRSRSRARSRRASDGERDPGRNDDEAKPFVPPKVWTAWPMPADQVPRVFHSSGILDDDEHDGHLDAIKASPRDLRPSAELEECLIATTTRIAREKWNAREDEDEDVSDLPVPGRRDAEKEKPESSQHTSEKPHVETRRDHPASPPVFFSPKTIARHSPSPSIESHFPPAQSEFAGSSQSRSRSHSPAQFLPPQASLAPVPIADDDHARTLLLPSVRRTIAKLDELLLGLHHARQAYAGEAKRRRRGGSETQTEEETSRSRSRGWSLKGKRKEEAAKVSLRSSRRDKEGEVVEEESGAAETNVEGVSGSEPYQRNDTSSARRPSRPQKRSRNSYSTAHEAKLNRLGLRDWSDVLGMVALTGWDSGVVARAGKRCASLFGEEMGFRTFHPPTSVSHATDSDGRGSIEVERDKRRAWFEDWSVSARGAEGYYDDEVGDDDENEDDDDDDDADIDVEEKENRH